MKRYLKYLIICLVIGLTLPACFILMPRISSAAEKGEDLNQFFYKANALYEKGDYANAIESYIAVLDRGFENGGLYYNIGNGFLKLGRPGYAILCYERAQRLIPDDSDLKSNFAYARTLAGDPQTQRLSKNIALAIIEKPFADMSLDKLAVLAGAAYLAVMLLSFIFIFNPVIARKLRLVFIIALAAFLIILTAAASRYYDEEILKYGIVLDKEIECKYEPIDKSTTYYKLHEGDKVVILQTRNGWRQIRRFDGKLAWAKREAIEAV